MYVCILYKIHDYFIYYDTLTIPTHLGKWPLKCSTQQADWSMATWPTQLIFFRVFSSFWTAEKRSASETKVAMCPQNPINKHIPSGEFTFVPWHWLDWKIKDQQCFSTMAVKTRVELLIYQRV